MSLVIIKLLCDYSLTFFLAVLCSLGIFTDLNQTLNVQVVKNIDYTFFSVVPSLKSCTFIKLSWTSIPSKINVLGELSELYTLSSLSHT